MKTRLFDLYDLVLFWPEHSFCSVQHVLSNKRALCNAVKEKGDRVKVE